MITIFTPTYNRAYILPKLYNSLLVQTSKDFEWIIVDDGSTDNTYALCHQWQNECEKFKITYLKAENQGKHIAINIGVNLAKGELFFIVDSDDYLADDAIERILEVYKTIKFDDRFAGVSGMKAFSNGERIGGKINFDILDCSMTDIRVKHKIKGDMAEVFKIGILKKYPFPKFEGENFLSENAIWLQISEKYILRFFNKNIYFAEYLKDGLTNNIHKKFIKNPQGTKFVFMQIIKSPKYDILYKMKACIKYWRYTVFYKARNNDYIKPIFWMYLFLPIGFIFCIYDILKDKDS